MTFILFVIWFMTLATYVISLNTGDFCGTLTEVFTLQRAAQWTYYPMRVNSSQRVFIIPFEFFLFCWNTAYENCAVSIQLCFVVCCYIGLHVLRSLIVGVSVHFRQYNVRFSVHFPILNIYAVQWLKTLYKTSICV